MSNLSDQDLDALIKELTPRDPGGRMNYDPFMKLLKVTLALQELKEFRKNRATGHNHMDVVVKDLIWDGNFAHSGMGLTYHVDHATDVPGLVFLEEIAGAPTTRSPWPTVDAAHKHAQERWRSIVLSFIEGKYASDLGEATDEMVEAFGRAFWGGHWQRGGIEHIRTALTAALSAAPTAEKESPERSAMSGVVVKAIQWSATVTDPDIRGGSTATGLTGFGQYLAFGDGTWADIDHHYHVVRDGSLDSAKAAAQSNFEQRINNVLEEGPVASICRPIAIGRPGDLAPEHWKGWDLSALNGTIQSGESGV